MVWDEMTKNPFVIEGYNGEHATSVNSTSRPAYDDFLAVGIKAKIPPVRCRELYEQVRENLNDIE